MAHGNMDHKKIALLLPLFISLAPYYVDTAVLDPALYLYPSPPLMPSDTGEEIGQWTRVSRSTKLLSPIESKETTTPTSIDERDSMESSETFWPRLRSIDYTLKQVHIPVTFSLSGNYGGYRGSSGVIGSAYANVGGTSVFSYGNSALAGSGYGRYGSNGPVRVFGGSSESAWTGWGNGKWGHYGKG